VKKASESNDAAAIQKALDQLTAAQHKAAESLYRQAGAARGDAQGGPEPGAPAGSASGANEPKTGDVIDAEVVDEGKQ
jgi:hypothetical protein